MVTPIGHACDIGGCVGGEEGEGGARVFTPIGHGWETPVTIREKVVTIRKKDTSDDRNGDGDVYSRRSAKPALRRATLYGDDTGGRHQ